MVNSPTIRFMTSPFTGGNPQDVNPYPAILFEPDAEVKPYR